MELTYQNLKERQRRERDGFGESLTLRVHRALSWLDHAERMSSDKDAQFISLWIAFNAAYADKMDASNDRPEMTVLREFIERLCDFDMDKLLEGIIFREFRNSIQNLLENKYIYRPFWEFQEGKIDEQEWWLRFEGSNKRAKEAFHHKDAATVLNILFGRLYTLRNQILHGSATWNSNTNRSQLHDGVAILAKVVPSIIKIMMDHPNALWRAPSYPVVEP